MDSQASLLFKRADNELLIATRLKTMSEDEKVKDMLQIGKEETFYSAVISHAYYSIFYAAKAILLTRGVRTSSPDIHLKTLIAFEKELVRTGVLDVKLLKIYKTLVIRADALLEIFRKEKGKRGGFTYQTIPQANREPAEDSIRNAKTFVANIKAAIGTE